MRAVLAVVGFAVLALFSSPLWAVEAATLDQTANAEKMPVKIVTLGDSITKGARSGVKPEETFAALLAAQLKEKGVMAEVVNVGIGGERTDGALARLEKEVIELKPNFVTIMYGTNDSYVDKGQTASRLTSEEFSKNLAALCEKLQAAQITPILMTEPRWGPAGRNGLDENPNLRLEKYMAECRALAEKRRLPLVDHFSHWTKAEARGEKIADWTTDQCHPNPAGHKVMAELMVPVVLTAIGAAK